MHNGDSTKIKASILREVYEDNLRIADPHLHPIHNRYRQGIKKLSRPVPLLFVFFACLLFYFIANSNSSMV